MSVRVRVAEYAPAGVFTGACRRSSADALVTVPL
jgi:hypothetical protein